MIVFVVCLREIGLIANLQASKMLSKVSHPIINFKEMGGGEAENLPFLLFLSAVKNFTSSSFQLALSLIPVSSEQHQK